jgi:hypothetical protein
MDVEGFRMANSFDERNERSLADLRVFVATLSDDQLHQPLDNGWTVSASLCHLAYWDRRASQILMRLRQDENFRSGSENADVINDALLYQWRRIPSQEAVAELLEAGDEVNGLIAGLDEVTAQRWRGLQVFALDRAEHRSEHLDELKTTFA